MSDRTERLGGSTIQHGPDSDRVYLMELEPGDMPELVERIDRLATSQNYSKVFAKVPGAWRRPFEARGYTTEALVPRFFGGRDDGHFMARYLDLRRAESRDGETISQVLALADQRSEADESTSTAQGYTLRTCVESDLPSMAKLYGEVFPSYPFPIHRPEFLAQTMATNVTYFGAWQGDELVALASAEKYPAGRHVEMTDFATSPDHRGRGLASALLQRAEAHALLEGYIIAYTIARALSPGMNITFARGGYRFAGTLINNTQISGHIESMNVWFKELRAT